MINNLKRFVASIQYDGSGYKGLVRQPGQKTIEGTLTSAFLNVFDQEIKIVVSGRTDAGVHALDQRIAFKTIIELEKIRSYWSRSLPKSIKINWIKEVEDDSFHVRHSVKLKTYRYKMKRSSYMTPFIANYFTEIDDYLTGTTFSIIAPVFIGMMDYTSVAKLDEGTNPIREIMSIDIIESEENIELVFKGKSFLRYMIRRIVAVMISFSKGELTLEEIQEKIQNKRKFQLTSPPNGLYLEKVEY